MSERNEFKPLNFFEDFSSVTVDGKTIPMSEYENMLKKVKKTKIPKYKVGDVVMLEHTKRKVKIIKIGYKSETLGEFDYAGIDINSNSSDEIIYPFNEDWIQEEKTEKEQDL